MHELHNLRKGYVKVIETCTHKNTHNPRTRHPKPQSQFITITVNIK